MVDNGNLTPRCCIPYLGSYFGGNNCGNVMASVYQYPMKLLPFIQRLLTVWLGLVVVATLSSPARAATTNTFVFSPTIVTTSAGSAAGPVNPTNGATFISGTMLSAGDVVVCDAIVNDVPGSTSDAWGAVNLNGAGYGGVVSATLGVLLETGTASGSQCQLFLNGTGSSTKSGIAQGSQTNRVRIALTCTSTGSTTNMSYLVQIDQGLTGTFSGTLAGTGVSFANNTITLTLGANNASHQFTPAQSAIAAAAITPAAATITVGLKATFSATVVTNQGFFPLSLGQHWLSNGVPILNATGLTYTTPANTSAGNGTQYAVVVTNLLSPGNTVTSPPAILTVRSTPGLVPFVFAPTAIANTSQLNPLSPPANIAGTSLLAGDTVVFDALITTNGPLTGSLDGWLAVNLLAGGFEGVTAAQLGLLVRMGSGTGQLFINGSGPVSPNPTAAGAATNRVRIELYPSVSGSTTNLGWLVKVDQNLTGTFLTAVTGTNLTFPNNTIPLSFGSYSVAGLITPLPVGLQSLQEQLSSTNFVAGGFGQATVTENFLNLSNVVLASSTPGLVYTSSNTNVISVSTNGYLTAVSTGSAKITATYSSLSATNTVQVFTAALLTNVTLGLSSPMLLNTTQQVSVLGNFVNVTNINLFNYGQTSFVLSNTNIASVSSNGSLTAVAPGLVSVSAVNSGVTSRPVQLSVTFPTNLFVFDSFGDGFWAIQNRGNTNNLVISSTGASQATGINTATDQQFEVLYNLQNSSFRLRNRTTWQCLGASSNSAGNVVLPVNYSGAPAQQWYLLSAGNGTYRILNASNGLALQSDNGHPAKVTLTGVSTNLFQFWNFVYQAHYPKKGCSGNEGSYAQFGLNWAYNYDDNTGVSLPAAVNYVPMIYAAQYWEPLSDAQSRNAGWLAQAPPNYLLTYNEPDNTGANGGSNTSTNDVIGAWAYIQALNLPLVSPACATTFGSWMNSFFSLISSNNYRVDYTAVHEYVPPNASSLMGVLQSVYTTFGRPVWLTEFSPVDWSNTQSWSENDDYNFLAEFMWQAENNDWLKRYAIFPFSGTNSANPWVKNGYRGNFFLADGATLSPYGELYAAWDGNLAVQSRRPYILHNLGTSFRMTDTNLTGTPFSSATKPSASSIYVRNTATEWALLPAPTTNHWFIISLSDGRRLRDNAGTLDLAPYGTTNAAVDWWFNGPDANGYYYLDNLAAGQSIQATGTAPAIVFSLVNDPAPSTATQWRLVEPYQPVNIATAAPPSLSISYTNQADQLTWAGNGLYYSVWRATNSGGPYTKIINTVTNTSYTDVFVQNGQTYYYVVTALNILGDQSAYSAEVVGHPSATTSVSLSSSVGGGGLQLNWPADHTGWRLQMNPVSLTVPSAWTTVNGSSATNLLIVPLNSATTNVFYRLVYP